MTRKPFAFEVAVVAFSLVGSMACGGEPREPSSSKKPLAAESARAPTLTPQTSGISSSLRIFGISPVNDRIVWASASGGTWLRTLDGGATWQSGVVPGAEALQFRDVEGISADIAYLLSVGDGPEAPRIYRTTDGGATWVEQYRNPDAAGFFDCFAFWTPRKGIVMADSVQRDGQSNRQFPILRTLDGEHWEDLSANLPPARPYESAFAASGTCAATHGGNRAWLVTAAVAYDDEHSEPARVLATTDAGDTWAAYEAPFPGTGLAGLFSIAFRSANHGIVGAGDLARGDDTESPNVARTSDGGKTWEHTANRTPFAGAVFGLAYANGTAGAGKTGAAHPKIVVATGPTGAAYSYDEGDTWTKLPDDVTGYWAVAFANHQAGWLVGSGGRILKIAF